MKKYKLLSLLLIISLFAGALSVPALALDEPETGAQCVVLMDTDTGNILYEKDADTTFGSAGMNMLMLALVLGDSLDRQDVRMDDVVTATENVHDSMPEGASSIGLVPGENLTVEQLLYASVLIAAQDSANALAEYVAGSCEDFVAAMNDKAEELGCEDTHFVNVHGASAEGQHTTAHDLALIARAVFQNTKVSAAFGTSSYTIPATADSGERPLSCPNALINSSSDQHYERAYAGKTATSSLGAHLVSAATYNGIDVIAVVAGCPEGVDRFTESKNLFEWVFANYGFRTLVSSTDVLDTVEVSMGDPDTVTVCASDNIQILLPNDEEPSELTLDLSYEHERDDVQLEAPINVGEYLGDLTVSMDGKVQGSARLVAATAVDISRLDYLRSQLDVLLQNPSVRNAITVLLAALGAYLLLVFVYLIQRIVHLHSLRRARKARAASRSNQELGWLELPNSRDADYLPEGGQMGEAPVGEEPAPVEGEAAPAEEEAAPAEEETAPAEEEVVPAEGEAVPAEEETAPAEEEAVPAEGEDAPVEDEAVPAEEETTPAEDEAAPVEEPTPIAEETVPMEEAVSVEEEPAPAEEEPASVEDEGEYVEDEGEYAEDEGEYAEDEGEYAEDEGEYVEDEGEYAEDGEYYEDEGEYAEDGEYYEDEGEYAEDGEYYEDEGEYAEDGEYYEDEGEYAEDEDGNDGGDEPPEKPKRHWWKRK